MTPESNRPQNQETRRILSNKSSFEITVPHVGRKIFLKITPDGFLSTKVEILKPEDKERFQVTIQLAETTRDLIDKRIKSKAAKLVPGSESVGLEMSIATLEEEFDQKVMDLRKMNFPENMLKNIVLDQGKQINFGEIHMGEMSPVVKEEVVALNAKIGNFYKK
jgi:hypothetical protein